MQADRKIFPADQQVGCIPVEMAMKFSGMEIFEKMLAGEISPPPIARTMNITLARAEPGVAEFRGIPLFDHYNPLGTVHGGWPATILDSALGCAVHTMLPAGTGFSTIEFKVNLMRPLSERTGEVVCTGRVVHFGRTTAVSEATLKDAGGKLIAMGTETCAVFPVSPGS